MDRALLPLILASRLCNGLTGGRWSETLCYRSLLPGAPDWLLILAACAEYVHPGHLAWTTNR